MDLRSKRETYNGFGEALSRAFEFAVTPRLVLTGLVIAMIIGFIGGLLPAIRAARMQVTTALRTA